MVFELITKDERLAGGLLPRAFAFGFIEHITDSPLYRFLKSKDGYERISSPLKP